MRNMLCVLLLFLFLLPGCVSASRREYKAKISGWEYVRIERTVPSPDCKYVVQEACGEKDSTRCYNWYKQRARFYGANIVVLTEDIRSNTATFGNVGPPTFKSSQTISALADYYLCPKCEPMKR